MFKMFSWRSRDTQLTKKLPLEPQTVQLSWKPSSWNLHESQCDFSCFLKSFWLPKNSSTIVDSLLTSESTLRVSFNLRREPSTIWLSRAGFRESFAYLNWEIRLNRTHRTFRSKSCILLHKQFQRSSIVWTPDSRDVLNRFSSLTFSV